MLINAEKKVRPILTVYHIPRRYLCPVCGEPADESPVLNGACIHEECLDEYLCEHAEEYADDFIEEKAAASYYKGWFEDLDEQDQLRIIRKAYQEQEAVEKTLGNLYLKNDRLSYCLEVDEDNFLLYVEERMK